MNTAMWKHPVTTKQMGVLEVEWGSWVEVLRPVEKGLACGDVGSGAMRPWEEIVDIVEKRMSRAIEAGRFGSQHVDKHVSPSVVASE